MKRRIAMLLVALALSAAVLPGCCKDTDRGFWCIIIIPFIDGGNGTPSTEAGGQPASPASPVGAARCSKAR